MKLGRPTDPEKDERAAIQHREGGDGRTVLVEFQVQGGDAIVEVASGST